MPVKNPSFTSSQSFSAVEIKLWLMLHLFKVETWDWADS